jgi:MraZ protein
LIGAVGSVSGEERGRAMKPFLGTFVNKVDAKGRVSVPARWRPVLAEQEFEGIVCFPSFTQGTIEGVTMARMEELSEMIDAEFDPFADAHGAFATSILADSFELPFDGEGRVVMPEQLLQHADIDAQAAFVGLGKRFQIWEPDAYRRYRDEARERAFAQRDQLGARRAQRVDVGGGAE